MGLCTLHASLRYGVLARSPCRFPVQRSRLQTAKHELTFITAAETLAMTLCAHFLSGNGETAQTSSLTGERRPGLIYALGLRTPHHTDYEGGSIAGSGL